MQVLSTFNNTFGSAGDFVQGNIKRSANRVENAGKNMHSHGIL